jgi:putative endonuclease
LNEHKSGAVSGFTKRYKVDRLVYFQETNDIAAAIAAEKQIKGMLRPKKIALIEEENPSWRDLSAES